MDKYNHRLGKLFLKLFGAKTEASYAITIGQTTYYSCPKDETSLRWRKHEDCHKMQWKQEGRLKFLFRYLWQWITKGYSRIDYEVEARKAESD